MPNPPQKRNVALLTCYVGLGFKGNHVRPTRCCFAFPSPPLSTAGESYLPGTARARVGPSRRLPPLAAARRRTRTSSAGSRWTTCWRTPSSEPGAGRAPENHARILLIVNAVHRAMQRRLASVLCYMGPSVGMNDVRAPPPLHTQVHLAFELPISRALTAEVEPQQPHRQGARSLARARALQCL